MIDFSINLLSIPFRETFRHALASRCKTSSIWVELKGSDGVVGYGESCPREFVTAESIQSCIQFYRRYCHQWKNEITNLQLLKLWIEQNRNEIDRAPAAWCAIELAFLDYFAKREELSVEALLGIAVNRRTHTYSAVIGNLSAAAFHARLNQFHQYGFRDYKIKLSGQPDRDKELISVLNNHPLDCSHVRMDANCFWSESETAINALQDLKYTFRGIEEPITRGDIEGCAAVGQALKTPIILDESVFTLSQLESLQSTSANWVINVRISKMGGILRSIEFLQYAHRQAIPTIMGAHVGETSLLTRAALVVAHQSQHPLFAQEGAAGTHLLARDIIKEPLMFGQAGQLSLSVRMITSPGFGITPMELTKELQRIKF